MDNIEVSTTLAGQLVGRSSQQMRRYAKRGTLEAISRGPIRPKTYFKIQTLREFAQKYNLIFDEELAQS